MDPDVADSMDPAEYFQAATIEHSYSDLQYNFMVVDLLDIIDFNYRIHLAADVSSLMILRLQLPQAGMENSSYIIDMS